IWFKDGVLPPAEGSAKAPDANGPPAAGGQLPAPPGAKPGEDQPAATADAGTDAAGKAPAPAARAKEPAQGAGDGAKPSRPIDLSARLVEAHVLRDGEKNELDRLWTEGRVHVTQAPANPDEKGVDIQGETLKMIRRAEGNLLTVTGDLGQLRLD